MSKIYTRHCPSCGKVLNYKWAQSYCRAKKDNNTCASCSAKRIDRTNYIKPKPKYGKDNPMYGRTIYDSWLEKYGEEEANIRKERHALNTKINNTKPMQGKSVYKVWLEKYGEEEANIRMEKCKKKHSDNNKGSKNNMYGKPSPQGSGNGWSGWYKNWYFRSLKELSYMINFIEQNNLKWRTADTKDLMIKYIDYKGSERTYRADFLVEDKFLVEVKPERLFSTPTNSCKKEAALKFCFAHDYEYQMVDPPRLTDKDIENLVSSGIINFTEHYKKLWQRRKEDVHQ